MLCSEALIEMAAAGSEEYVASVDQGQSDTSLVSFRSIFFKKLEYSSFTMLCSFLPDS